MDKSYFKGCSILWNVCGAVAAGDKILIITDDSCKEVGEAMYEFSVNCSDATLICMKPRSTHGEEPTPAIAAAMAASDVIYSATAFSLYNTSARIEACKRGARFINMADYQMWMFEEGPLFVDFQELREKVNLTAGKIVGKELHFTTPAGTDFTTSIVGREADIGYGVSIHKGDSSSPPNIECAVGPADDSANGVLVVDGSIPLPGLGVIKEPIRIEISKGYITSIEGGEEADILRETLASYGDKRVYLIAEVGFGMNPGASLCGRMLVDEGVFGTMHIGIGNNLSYGGSCDTPVHIDLIMKEPTCLVDGRVVVRDGVYV